MASACIACLELLGLAQHAHTLRVHVATLRRVANLKAHSFGESTDSAEDIMAFISQAIADFYTRSSTRVSIADVLLIAAIGTWHYAELRTLHMDKILFQQLIRMFKELRIFWARGEALGRVV